MKRLFPHPPPEKMGAGFYAALALLALLVLMILFLNYPGSEGRGRCCAGGEQLDASGPCGPFRHSVLVQNGTIVTAAFDRQGGMSGSTGATGTMHGSMPVSTRSR